MFVYVTGNATLLWFPSKRSRLMREALEEMDQICFPLYHHARPLEHVVYGYVSQARGIDPDFEAAYQWLVHEVGFYPLFLAVGGTLEAISMTGYQDQWRRKRATPEERHQGTIVVLFSFNDVSAEVYMDYLNWHIVLNSGYKDYQITARERRMIFRPSWWPSAWLR